VAANPRVLTLITFFLARFDRHEVFQRRAKWRMNATNDHYPTIQTTVFGRGFGKDDNEQLSFSTDTTSLIYAFRQPSVHFWLRIKKRDPSK
jgi:hypothetical protein